jgi:hypothetical protein
MPRRLLGAAVCALATHTLLYGSLTPTDGLHGYFVWYEPLVLALSALSLLGLAGLLAVALAARRLGRPLRRSVEAPPPLAASARSIAVGGLAFLLVQESLERSVAAGQPAFALFTPTQWLLLLAGMAACSAALALALRAAVVAARRLLVAPPSCRVRPAHRGWSLAAVRGRPRRRSPLADRLGLRAPPLLAG